jgi:hypothetical protein
MLSNKILLAISSIDCPSQQLPASWPFLRAQKRFLAIFLQKLQILPEFNRKYTYGFLKFNQSSDYPTSYARNPEK